MATNNPSIKVWGMPILLGVIIIIGLILAIIGTGIWHVFSWLTLAIPTCIMLKHSARVFKNKSKK
jgi:nitrate/nitrite transporter NarK